MEQTNIKTTPKDFFLHLGVIVSLYTTAISFLNLAFRLIDNVFPRETLYYGFYGNTISVPVATLIIVFPIFIILSWLLNREYKSLPEKRNLWVRKWLVYITLFVAGIVVAIDLIVVLVSFLSGEIITAGFILKALSVFAVAVAIFGYYITDLRNKATSKVNKISAWVSGIVILGLIIAGFSIVGSPQTQRMVRYDQTRVSDLQSIQWQIVNFWQSKEVLPQNLEELRDPISGFRVPMDPQTGEPYEYEVLGEMSFQLCANFNLSSSDLPAYSRPTLDMLRGFEQDVWDYEEGRHCFEREIDPELYPVSRF